MNRRDFMRFASFLAGSLPLAIAAAGPRRALAQAPETETEAKVAELPEASAEALAAGFVAIATLDQFEDETTLMVEDIEDLGNVLLIRDGDDILAFNPRCPHAGCDVAPSGDDLVCPCHNSRFDLEGAVTRGPARQGLTAYLTELEDDLILVKAA